MRRQQPNILFILTDQQRPDSLGAYGATLPATPNLDALAAESVVFDNCYVQNPLCCPSRYSILTGRYPHAHGVISNWYAPHPWETSFAHRLSRAGYRTGAIGKMHLTPWHDLFGFDGRIIAEAKFHVSCPDDYARFLEKHGWSRAKLYDVGTEQYVQDCTAVKSKVPEDLHVDGFVGRAACEYVRRAEEPFCLMVGFLGPHNPYDPPAPFDAMFTDADLPARNMAEGEVQRKPREAYDYINNNLKWPFKTDELTERQLRLVWAYYLGCCAHIDARVGRIIEALKERGLYEDTVILFTSDHGDLLGDHGLVYKQCFYEQSVRAPLIWHAPERFAAGRSAAMVESIDIFNTLCELGGASPGPGRHGLSILPLLDDPSRRGSHREAAFSENYFGTMVRQENWKMVYYPGKPYGELYDLASDAQEQDNLWEKLDDSPVKRRLKDLLLEWALAERDALPAPIRPSHQDAAPRHLYMTHGHTAERPHQEWQFDGMEDLYRDWNFAEPSLLRK
jgi:choline-sulfatase